MERLNGWQRLGVIVSGGWIVFILVILINTYTEVDGFEEATSGFCPSLREPFVAWVDAKTNEKISVYRPGESSLNCGVIADRAKKLRESFLKDEITPELSIQYTALVGAIVVPVVLFWLSAYFLVWVVRWVTVGFRGR